MIECKSIHKTYSLKKSDIDIHALNNLNLQINTGEFVVIMGPSGSGKSTLLNALIGLIKVDDGIIKINEEDITDLTENDLATLRQNNIGFIFQFYNLHEGLTALENVELPLLISNNENVKERRRLAKEYLELVNLKGKENKFFYELSGGERQRVGIARALINDPDIILADEPTGDLDSEMAQEILNLMISLNKERKKTIIIVTHDVSLLKKGMRLLEMRDGSIFSDVVVS